MSAKEYAEWVEFFHLEPFGWEAQCFSSGIVAATIANVNRDTKKKSKPFEAIDFVPGAKRSAGGVDSKKLKAELLTAYAGLAGLKNKGQKAKRNPRNAPRNREGNKSGRSDGVVINRSHAHRNRPNNKQNHKEPKQD